MSRGFVLGPCLACGEDARNTKTAGPWWSGVVGPFCSQTCRDKQEDKAAWERGNAYALRVEDNLKTMTSASYSTPTHQPFETGDVARAFVIGYAAGVEARHGVGRRTVKKCVGCVLDPHALTDDDKIVIATMLEYVRGKSGAV